MVYLQNVPPQIVPQNKDTILTGVANSMQTFLPVQKKNSAAKENNSVAQ
jgi:hypothetical protein